MISVEVNSQPVVAMLGRVIGVIDPPAKMTMLAARATEPNVRETFRHQADPWGNPWAPHSPVTVAERKRKNILSVALLFARGDMYNSLHSEQQGDDAVVTMGGPGIFAEVQQQGNAGNLAWGRGSAPIPARPTFPIRGSAVDLPQKWADDVVSPLEQALAEAIAA